MPNKAKKETKKEKDAVDGGVATGTREPIGPKELSEILKIPVSTIYYWVHCENIPHYKMGRHLRFFVDDVLNHFKQSTTTISIRSSRS